MKCPNCGAEMEEGKLYCEHCGEDIHIVPDFEPEVEYNMEQTLSDIAKEMEPEPAEEEEPVHSESQDWDELPESHVPVLGFLIPIIIPQTIRQNAPKIMFH